jgi:hypothetical protein
MRQEKKMCTKLICLLDHVYCLQISNCKSVFIDLFDILPKMYRTVVVEGPDIRYPALTGYPVSGF